MTFLNKSWGILSVLFITVTVVRSTPVQNLNEFNDKDFQSDRVGRQGILEIPKQIATIIRGVISESLLRAWSTSTSKPSISNVTPESNTPPGDTVLGDYFIKNFLITTASSVPVVATAAPVPPVAAAAPVPAVAPAPAIAAAVPEITPEKVDAQQEKTPDPAIAPGQVVITPTAAGAEKPFVTNTGLPAFPSSVVDDGVYLVGVPTSDKPRRPSEVTDIEQIAFPGGVQGPQTRRTTTTEDTFDEDVSTSTPAEVESGGDADDDEVSTTLENTEVEEVSTTDPSIDSDDVTSSTAKVDEEEETDVDNEEINLNFNENLTK